MIEFTPSQGILEEICEGEEDLVKQYTYFPTKMTQAQMEKTFSAFITGLIYQVAENFRWAMDIDKNMHPQPIVAVGEGLKNAVIHGSNNVDRITYGLFMGSKGICHGFHDSGDYFNSQKTKEIFESKTPITEFGEARKGFSGARMGVKYIYGLSDKIEVDTTEGVLYFTQLKESLQKGSD